MQSTMKIFCAVLLSFLLLKVASAFTAGGPTLVFSRNRRQTAIAALKETAAEAYLTQCLDEWDLLEKELVNLKAHAKVSKDENANQIAAAELAEKMLHKALDTARAKRDVEMEHVLEAHKVYDEAKREEMVGEAALHQMSDDIHGSIQQAGMLEGLDETYEDTERLRDFSVAHAAHDQGMDWIAKVQEAERVAQKARMDFTSAEHKLEELKQNEAELKAALKELHIAKNTLLMHQWEQQQQE